MALSSSSRARHLAPQPESLFLEHLGAGERRRRRVLNASRDSPLLHPHHERRRHSRGFEHQGGLPNDVQRAEARRPEAHPLAKRAGDGQAGHLAQPLAVEQRDAPIALLCHTHREALLRGACQLDTLPLEGLPQLGALVSQLPIALVTNACHPGHGCKGHGCKAKPGRAGRVWGREGERVLGTASTDAPEAPLLGGGASMRLLGGGASMRLLGGGASMQESDRGASVHG